MLKTDEKNGKLKNCGKIYRLVSKKRENVWKKIKKRKNISKTNTILNGLNKISQKNVKKKLEKLWRKFNNGNNLSIQVKDQNLCNKIKKAK